MNEIVVIKDIRTYFHIRKGFFKTVDLKAVDGITLSLKSGETVAIVGESGSGKTTLGRTALRLEDSISGEIFFENKNITKINKNTKWFRRKAQMIFQDPFTSLNPNMNVEQILEEPLIIHGFNKSERTKRIIKALADVRLLPSEEYLPKFPHMLSGGQRQRVGVARSLVLEPIFLVADEPVSMIDASSRAEILVLIREIQTKYDVGVMYITHDIATAKYFSDRIAVMYAGKIVEIGQTLKILKKPLHPYTVALMDAVPDPNPKNRFKFREVVPGEPPNPISPPKGCRFNPRCPYSNELCRTDEPLLRDVSNRFVACHYAEDFI
jgi:peptide/nickel transport system ATP-binding protein